MYIISKNIHCSFRGLKYNTVKSGLNLRRRFLLYAKYLKRILDFILSLVAIILLIVVFIAIDLAILLTSKGSPFFRQERLGKNGKVFKIIKFRTMILGAEKVGDGLRVKSENDTRITKVGSFLRKTSLDELPQLFNVLVGDMSLVGPRPPVTYHPYNGVSNYPEWANPRFLLKPGITGLAQINVRNSVPWDERMVHDIEYVKNITFILDLKILFLTILKVFRRESVYGNLNTNVQEDKVDV